MAESCHWAVVHQQSLEWWKSRNSDSLTRKQKPNPVCAAFDTECLSLSFCVSMVCSDAVTKCNAHYCTCDATHVSHVKNGTADTSSVESLWTLKWNERIFAACFFITAVFLPLAQRGTELLNIKRSSICITWHSRLNDSYISWKDNIWKLKNSNGDWPVASSVTFQKDQSDFLTINSHL